MQSYRHALLITVCMWRCCRIPSLSPEQEILYAATAEDGGRIMRETQVEFAGREYTEEELSAADG